MFTPDYNIPIQQFTVFQRNFFVLRDDLIHPHFNGNKARKFFWLNNTPKDSLRRIISWGGAQSNAMYALAYLCRHKGWEFIYYAKTLPDWLRRAAKGNLAFALAHGMKLREISPQRYDKISRKLAKWKKDSYLRKVLIIPQGGADEMSEEGVSSLIQDIVNIAQSHKNTAVVLSSGTGTTSYFLQKNLIERGYDIPVFTLPCIAEKTYLEEQFARLGPSKFNPQILHLEKPIAFANPDLRILTVYHELTDAGIEFDLLYDCPTWLALRENSSIMNRYNIIFIHSGGLHGNQSQLDRYKWTYRKLKTSLD